MTDIIIVAIVVIIVGLAAFYIYKSRKNGNKCVGCPHSCSCQSKKCSDESPCK